MGNGGRQEATATVHPAIGLTPDNTASYYDLRELLSYMGEYQEAERDYRRDALVTSDQAVRQAKATATAGIKEQITVA